MKKTRLRRLCILHDLPACLRIRETRKKNGDLESWTVTWAVFKLTILFFRRSRTIHKAPFVHLESTTSDSEDAVVSAVMNGNVAAVEALLGRGAEGRDWKHVSPGEVQKVLLIAIDNACTPLI